MYLIDTNVVSYLRGPVEEPPKVFVLSYVCLNVYKYCVN